MIFHTEKWPIVYFKVNINNMTDELFEDYKRKYVSLLLQAKREGVKIILVCDLLTCFDSFPTDSKYINEQYKFNQEIEKHNRDFVRCICILCKSSVLKNMLNLYFSMTRPVTPYKICKNFQKGEVYLKENYGIEEINFEDFHRKKIEKSNENNMFL